MSRNHEPQCCKRLSQVTVYSSAQKLTVAAFERDTITLNLNIWDVAACIVYRGCKHCALGHRDVKAALAKTWAARSVRSTGPPSEPLPCGPKARGGLVGQNAVQLFRRKIAHLEARDRQGGIGRWDLQPFRLTDVSARTWERKEVYRYIYLKRSWGPYLR